MLQAPPSSGKKQKGGRKQAKGGEGSSSGTAAERQLAGLLQVPCRCWHALALPTRAGVVFWGAALCGSMHLPSELLQVSSRHSPFVGSGRLLLGCGFEEPQFGPPPNLHFLIPALRILAGDAPAGQPGTRGGGGGRTA